MVLYVEYYFPNDKVQWCIFPDDKKCIDKVIRQHKKKFKLNKKEDRRVMRVLRHYINIVEFHKCECTVRDTLQIHEIISGWNIYHQLSSSSRSILSDKNISMIMFKSSG
jgi:hypothetical protein